MSIIARFLILFGASFLSVAVIMFSYLRKKIDRHSKREKKRKIMAKRKKKIMDMFKGNFKQK